MKVLFATGGSQSDQLARRFVANARWPLGSEIEVLGVVRPPRLDLSGQLFERNERDLEDELRSIAWSLPLDGSTATWRCVIGQPADAIAERAREISADLIVVGMRDHGRIASAVLGSVSAGVVDRAPCPVLVARSGSADRVVLADDGSLGAAAAATLVQDSPIFGQSAVEVVSVVDMGRPLSFATGGYVEYLGSEPLYLEHLDAERGRLQTALRERADAFVNRARPVCTAIREGDAAREILAAAAEFAADLIVVGSRGNTGLTRFFAGSVARQVVLDATCSVLIVRGSAALSPARTADSRNADLVLA